VGQEFQTVIKWKTCFYTVRHRKLARVNKINGFKNSRDGSGDDKYPSCKRWDLNLLLQCR
jgi:hypothetical protein